MRKPGRITTSLRPLAADALTLALVALAADTGRISLAARSLHLALGAASRRISEFESRLGMPLFHRTARGVKLTQAGRSVLPAVAAALANYREMAALADDIARGAHGHVRLLANNAAIVQFLPDVLSRFAATHARVRVELIEHLSDVVVQEVAAGRANLGIASEDSTIEASLSVAPFREDQLVLVVPKGHALAGHESVRFAHTLDYDHIALESGSALYRAISREAGRLGRTLRVRVQVRGYETMHRMVAAGLGVGVLPAIAADLYGRAARATMVRLDEAWASRRLVIVTRGHDTLDPLEIELFAALLAPPRLPMAQSKSPRLARR